MDDLPTSPDDARLDRWGHRSFPLAATGPAGTSVLACTRPPA